MPIIEKNTSSVHHPVAPIAVQPARGQFGPIPVQVAQAQITPEKKAFSFLAGVSYGSLVTVVAGYSPTISVACGVSSLAASLVVAKPPQQTSEVSVPCVLGGIGASLLRPDIPVALTVLAGGCIANAILHETYE